MAVWAFLAPWLYPFSTHPLQLSVLSFISCFSFSSASFILRSLVSSIRFSHSRHLLCSFSPQFSSSTSSFAAPSTSLSLCLHVSRISSAASRYLLGSSPLPSLSFIFPPMRDSSAAAVSFSLAALASTAAVAILGAFSGSIDFHIYRGVLHLVPPRVMQSPVMSAISVSAVSAHRFMASSKLLWATPLGSLRADRAASAVVALVGPQSTGLGSGP